MIEHKDEAYRTIGIGCDACEDGELHSNCDFTKHIQSHYKTEKMEIRLIEHVYYTLAVSESKDEMQLIKKESKNNNKSKSNLKDL